MQREAFEKPEIVASNDEAASTELDLVPGTIIGERFEIIERVGRGGQSTIYKAKHLLLDRVVALKLIHPGSLQDRAMERFRQEAQLAMSFSHPNIAGVKDFGQDAHQNPYIVMDFIDGRSLSEVLKSELMIEQSRAAEIIRQISNALSHAHAKGVIHRDIKPGNVMLEIVDGVETVRLVDFGLAKIFQSDAAEGVNLTQTGDVLGTPTYMSPEQGYGYKLDARSDIYSLGCLFYELITGTPPFMNESALAVLMQHVHEPPKSMRVQVPEVSKELDDLVLCCLAKAPADRFQSAADLCEHLEKIQKGLPVPRRRAKKRLTPKKFFAITAAAVLIGLVAAVLSLSPISLTPPPSWVVTTNQAVAQKGLGNFDSARAMLNAALGDAKDHNAPDPDIENIYKELGHLCVATDDFPNAIKYLNQALALNEKHGENFERGSLHDWMSGAYIEQKDYLNAVGHADMASRIKRRVLGSEHPLILPAFAHQGQALRGIGRLQDAEKIDREALKLANKLYPNGTDVFVADLHLQLGNVLADQGKVDEAIKNYEAWLESSAKSRGKDSPVAQKNARMVADYLRKNGQEAEAAQIETSFQ